MRFGLMFFASSEDALQGSGYDLVIKSARFADEHGLTSIWVPERHFTRFGCLYPNPAVLQAALARETKHVRLQAGSVVLPLHDPLRVAEEWSVVDNLSGGRVGISFASGWNPNDFAFFPDRYANRHSEMFRGIETVRRLWRGESVPVRSGTGDTIDVRIYPTPVQAELPIWVTAAGNPSTFARAGEIGAHLLTHLLDQDAPQLAEKIAVYRDGRARAGHDPAAGCVTIMLHTFVGDDLDQVRRIVRAPYCEYLKQNALPLLRELAISRGTSLDPTALSSEDLDVFAGFLFERFLSTRSLMGTADSCLPLLRELRRSGVDEIACLLDFGPAAETILHHLPHLVSLVERAGREAGERAEVRQAPPLTVTASRKECQTSCTDSIQEIQSRCVEEISGPAFYQGLRARGIQLEGSFRGITRIWRRDGEAIAEIRPDELPPDGFYRMHPALLDSCFQALGGALPQSASAGLYLPVGMRGFEILRTPVTPLWSHVRLAASKSRQGELDGSIRILDKSGNLVAHAASLRLRPAVIHDAPSPLAGSLYEVKLEPEDLDRQIRTDVAGTWLICMDSGGLGVRLSQLLTARGGQCVPIECEREQNEMQRCIDEALAAVNHKGRQLRGVVHLGMLDTTPARSATLGDIQNDFRETIGGSFLLMQTLARLGFAAPVWMVSRDGHSEPLLSSLRGFARSCAVEHPELSGGFVDLDPAASVDEACALLLRELDAQGDEVTYRDGKRYVARLAETVLQSSSSVSLNPDATYLITGGTGGLGLEVAEWMAQKGARHIVLMARNTRSNNAGPAIQQIEKHGARALVIAADVSQEPDVAKVLATIAGSMPPLRGIVHAAGVLDDALLIHQDWPRFERVCAPKVDGAWVLHTQTTGLKLDFFVLFSSGSTWIPTQGQINYAAANAFLDGLAAHRRELGLPGLSIGWGPWARVGHASTEYGRSAHERLAERGVEPIEPRFGLEALEQLLTQPISHAGVFHVDWPRLFKADPALGRSTLLRSFAKPGQSDVVKTAIIDRLERASASERVDILIEHVTSQVVRVMKLQSAARLDPDRGLFDLGMDSVTALELKTKLQTSLGRPIPSTLVFDHPSVSRIARYLGGDDGAPPPLPDPSAPMAAAIEKLSEEETEALLLEKLAALKKAGVGGGGS